MEWLEDLKRRPAVAHLLRAVERYSQRLGAQFAAGITYFSVLSLVPIMMFGFSILGMTVTVLRPDWLTQITELINAQFNPDTDLGAQVGTIVRDALGNWGTIGAIGLLTAAWSGAGWVANLKAAVRAQWRREFDLVERKGNPVLEVLVNLAILMAILVGVGITFAASLVATSLASTVTELLRLDQVPGGGVLLRLLPLAVSLLGGFALFYFLFTVLPETKEPRRTVAIGAAIGSVALAALQYFTSAIVGVFAGNAAAAIFGPVIVLMLFLNLFATLILVLAAWVSTAEPEPLPVPAVEEIESEVPEPEELPEPVVNQWVAERSLGVGLGTGYVIGAATGVGLGAVIAAMVSRLTGWRRR